MTEMRPPGTDDDCLQWPNRRLAEMRASYRLGLFHKPGPHPVLVQQRTKQSNTRELKKKALLDEGLEA